MAMPGSGSSFRGNFRHLNDIDQVDEGMYESKTSRGKPFFFKKVFLV